MYFMYKNNQDVFRTAIFCLKQCSFKASEVNYIQLALQYVFLNKTWNCNQGNEPTCLLGYKLNFTSRKAIFKTE